MKTTETKVTNSSDIKYRTVNQSFFNKDGEGAFFSSKYSSRSNPFFSPSQIQTKSTINRPSFQNIQQSVIQRKTTAAERPRNNTSALLKPSRFSSIMPLKYSASTPTIQCSPLLFNMLPGLGEINWREIINSFGKEVFSNLHLPIPAIPFPFDDPLELPLPWSHFPGVDPWEIIWKIIIFLRNIMNRQVTMPGGGGGAGSTTQNPLADMSTFQSPGGSGWRGAIYGCYRNTCSRPHRGWDLYAPVGTNIYSVESGTVSHHQNPGGYGDFIFLTAGARRYRYAHLSARQPAGQYSAGSTIGQTGVTGNAVADRPHLHLEVQQNNRAIDPAGTFATPNMVRAAFNPFAITNINFSETENCNPCAM